MRSKTSFCSPTLIKQTAIRRFWPVLAVYALILVFIMFIFTTLAGEDLRNDLSGMDADWIDSLRGQLRAVATAGGAVLAMFAGIILAKICFGYLNQPNTVQFYHALPLKRAAIFWSSYLSGILLFAVPILFTWVVSWAFLAANGLLPYLAAEMLPWLGIMLAVHFFFYTFAVLIGFFTGNGAAHVVAYAVFNGLVVFLYGMLEALCNIYLFGYVGMWNYEIPAVVRWLTPIQNIMTSATAWTYVAYVLVGIVFTALALLLYKRRRLELAGNVIAVRVLRPVFVVGFAVCFSLLFAMFLSIFFTGSYGGIAEVVVSVFLILFALVGYYIARMLVMRTFKAFSGSAKGLLAFMAVFVLGVCVLQFDLTGYAARVPNADDVEFVVCTRQDYEPKDYYNARYIALGDRRNDRGLWQLRDQPQERFDPLTGDLALLARKHAPSLFEERANIDAAMDIHRWITQNEEIVRRRADIRGNLNYASWINITYQMKDGSQLSRRYAVYSLENLPATMETLYNSQEYLTKRLLCPGIDKAAAVYARIDNLHAEGRFDYDKGAIDSTGEHPLYAGEEDAQSLLDAIIADVMAGNVGRYYPSPLGAFQEEASTIAVTVIINMPRDPLSLLMDYDPGYGDRSIAKRSVGVVVLTRSANIIKWMEEHSIDTKAVYEQRVTDNESNLSNWYHEYDSYNGGNSPAFAEEVY